MNKIRVTVWNEYVHELENEKIAKIYPKGIHGCIAEFLEKAGFTTKTATLNMPEHGLTEEVLSETDVLVYWGHRAHALVEDEIVNRIHQHVLDGMGIILLHSAHASKIFHKLCGTRSQNLKWRVADETEILWVVNPSHPITKGISEKIILPKEEMYGEYFSIPQPDELIFMSWFEGGEVFRSGFTYQREKGKVFYFRPGHEEYPTFYNEEIQKVIINAVNWAIPNDFPEITQGKALEPLMPIKPKD